MARERGIQALGLDLSIPMLAKARQSHAGLKLIRAEAGKIPLASSCLDGVLSECVLSLTQDPAGVLAECARVLKPGGRLGLSDIYLRNPEAGQEGPPLPGCLGGALDRDRPRALACSAGLEVLDWEDHSPCCGNWPPAWPGSTAPPRPCGGIARARMTAGRPLPAWPRPGPGIS